mmetsp:Transcript_14212/g.17891  ORF Transcript_14212/g.17891 Transcript_14212/m.17891 type:complete len:201 (-) Transcript_14212:142-744(-)
MYTLSLFHLLSKLLRVITKRILMHRIPTKRFLPVRKRSNNNKPLKHPLHPSRSVRRHHVTILIHLRRRPRGRRRGTTRRPNEIPRNRIVHVEPVGNVFQTQRLRLLLFHRALLSSHDFVAEEEEFAHAVHEVFPFGDFLDDGAEETLGASRDVSHAVGGRDYWFSLFAEGQHFLKGGGGWVFGGSRWCRYRCRWVRYSWA